MSCGTSTVRCPWLVLKCVMRHACHSSQTVLLVGRHASNQLGVWRGDEEERRWRARKAAGGMLVVAMVLEGLGSVEADDVTSALLAMLVVRGEGLEPGEAGDGATSNWCKTAGKWGGEVVVSGGKCKDHKLWGNPTSVVRPKMRTKA